MLSWIRGRARFSELSPLQRVGAVLVLSGLLGSVGGWVVFASLSAGHALQPLLQALEPHR